MLITTTKHEKGRDEKENKTELVQVQALKHNKKHKNNLVQARSQKLNKEEAIPSPPYPIPPSLPSLLISRTLPRLWLDGLGSSEARPGGALLPNAFCLTLASRKHVEWQADNMTSDEGI